MGVHCALQLKQALWSFRSVRFGYLKTPVRSHRKVKRGQKNAQPKPSAGAQPKYEQTRVFTMQLHKKTSIQSHYDDFEFCFCEAEHCKYSAAFWQVSSSQAVYMVDMCKGLWPHCVACICNEWSHGICWKSFETKQQIKTPADRWGVTALINLLEGIKNDL